MHLHMCTSIAPLAFSIIVCKRNIFLSRLRRTGLLIKLKNSQKSVQACRTIRVADFIFRKFS